jgi:hypothetical protein
LDPVELTTTKRPFPPFFKFRFSRQKGRRFPPFFGIRFFPTRKVIFRHFQRTPLGQYFFFLVRLNLVNLKYRSLKVKKSEGKSAEGMSAPFHFINLIFRAQIFAAQYSIFVSFLGAPTCPPQSLLLSML